MIKVISVLIGLVGLAMGEAPYPPSGWKPSGALLVLPSRQQSSRLENQVPRQQQQLPSAYGPPQQQPTYPNQDEAAQGSDNGAAAAEQQREGGQTGSYYVLLPEGRLQKIQYATGPAAPAEGNTEAQGNFQFRQNNFGQQSQYSGFPTQNAQAGQSNLNFQSEQAFRQNSFAQQSSGHQQENLGFGQATNNVNNFQKFNDPTLQQNKPTTFHNSVDQKKVQSSTEQSSVKTSQTDNQQATENPAAPPKLIAQFSEAQLKANGPFPDGYVASVQFSDVAPITAPVYVFNPAPLVRVLRMTP